MGKKILNKWPYADRFRSIVARLAGAGRARGASSRSSAIAPTALLAALAVGAGLVAHSVRADAPTVPVNNEIHFAAVVDGNKGHVICALFRRNGWLNDALQQKSAPVLDNQAECIFKSVAPDVYAISAFHDENDNQRLDTNFLGVPTESWCTSRHAKALLGPPSFDDAKFRYPGGVMRHRADLR